MIAIDRFPPGHDRGSSHGQTRVIRKAYCEHPDYVPLLCRAYELWRELEKLAGVDLYKEIGLLQVGPPGGYVLSGVVASARQYGLPVERLTNEEIPQRFPGLVAPAGTEGVFEREAGYLLVERCVQVHWQQAASAGAELRSPETVCEWQADSQGVVVRTDRDTYHAARMILAAGAWASGLLRQLSIPLIVRRKHLHWFANDDERYSDVQKCPVYLFELPDGIYYGFPQIDERGVKVAEHSGGEAVMDPLQLPRATDSRDLARIEFFLRACLPGVSRRALDHTVCMYTMSPDEHFIVDHVPETPQVCFAAGLSGHGFKFTSVLGEVLADLALDGCTRMPVEFLRSGRFALRP